MLASKIDTRPNSENSRKRRFAVFEAWSAGGTFTEIGARFGVKRARARELVWKVIAFEGGRSERARQWMVKLDSIGKTDYVRKYDQEWAKPRRPKRVKRSRVISK
jgi:hypothetical protein